MAGRVEGSVWGYHNTSTMLGLAAAVWLGLGGGRWDGEELEGFQITKCVANCRCGLLSC